jgi:transglutaminase-like putative cysteine protease
MLRAQFQQPTEEELKMTADPKAPGAAAVYLYVEENSDDTLSIRTYYVRIKVLAEKGKELATIRIPYERGDFKVAHIEGRTIHSDGTVVPLEVKPDDLVEFKSKHYEEDVIVFTLPSAEVGSILEYRYQLRYKDNWVFSPTWNIQQAYYVHKAHYSFHPNDGSEGYVVNSRGQRLHSLMYSVTPATAPIVIQKVKGRFDLDVTDIPPPPDEDWMPPLNTIKERVEFYYTYAESKDDFWNYEAKVWAVDVGGFTTVTSTLKKAADAIVSPGDSDEQKARALYAGVMKLDNTDYSRVKSEAERKKEKLKENDSAEDVWKNQSGRSNSIALLYVALARASGLNAWPMRVTARNVGIFDPAYLNFGQLTDYIAIVNIGGKEVFVDPGEAMCPFGSLGWAHTLTAGYRLSEGAASTALTPAASYKSNVDSRSADLTVDAQGNVNGTVRFLLSGSDAVYWRQVARENDENEVKKQFIESIRDDLPEGVEASFDHFIGLDDYESNLMAIVQISGTTASATGKYFFLPGLFFESRAKHPFVAQETRITPIDLHYPKTEKDTVIYHLPPGYSVESTPKTDLAWPGFAVLRIESNVAGDTIQVNRVFARNFTLLAPNGYNSLHDFYQKLAAADQQQIVLTRAPAVVKGN